MSEKKGKQAVRMSLEEVKQRVIPVLKRHDVVHAAIFGSFARGEPGEDSDLDILVEFGSEKSLLDLVALQLELEEALRREVDVLTYRAIHPRIKGKGAQRAGDNPVSKQAKVFIEHVLESIRLIQTYTNEGEENG